MCCWMVRSSDCLAWRTLRTEGSGIHKGQEKGLNISEIPEWLKVCMASDTGRASVT